MDRYEITTMVRAQIERMLDDGLEFGDSDALTHYGLDSLRSVELTLNLESSFDLVFEDEELDFENFGSVRRIVDLVAAKVGADA